MTCNHYPRVHPDVYRFTGTSPHEPLPAFAWPGGYPVIYFDTDGCTLCAPCASAAAEYSACTSAAEVYYEGPPVICEQCNAVIESAYGDPDEEAQA